MAEPPDSLDDPVEYVLSRLHIAADEARKRWTLSADDMRYVMEQIADAIAEE